VQNEHVNALKRGSIVAEYRIEGLLGHGGFGMTYLARDLNLNSMVAIKEYLPQEFAVRAANSTIVPKSQADGQGYEWGLERFKQEARALARFKHPNIVRCARLIEANNTAYMVMDYEQGMALGEVLKKHGPTLGEAQILGLFVPILDGLTALHETELIHRDIKPGNIYVRAKGEPMLIDFGAVRHAIGAHSRSLTAVVTPGYAPIEQYSSEGKQGPWTDLYAIGATMYTCVHGRAPVDAARRSAAISDGDSDPYISAARVGNGKYSDGLLAAVDWAMQFRTRDRPQSADEFKTVLRGLPTAPAPLELPDEDGDSEVTNIGARPATQRASRPATGIPPPAENDPREASRPQAKRMIPPPAEEPEAAPAEWFEAPAEEAPPPAATQVMPPPMPAESRASQRIVAAQAPEPQRAKEAPPEPPAARPREATRRVPPVAAAPPRAAGPPSGGRRVLPLAAALLLAAGAAAAVYWFVQQSAAKREARLWQTAQRTDSVDAYRTYLAVCEACSAKPEAEQRLQALSERAAVETRGAAQLQAIAELKVRFAQHLIAGEYSAPLDSNAHSVLAELAVLAPDDPFVATGRTQLERREQAAKPVAPAKAAAPIVAVAPPPKQPAGSTIKAPTTAAAPAPKAAPPAQADTVGQMFDLLAKFELGMARTDQDAGLVAAAAALKELEQLAPGDSAVKDARRRYDAAKNKPAPVVAAPIVAAPSATPAAPPPALPRAIPAGSALKPQAAAPPPAVLPGGSAVRAAPSASITNARAAEKVLRVKISGKWDAPPMVALPAGTVRLGDSSGRPDEQPAGPVKVAPFAIGQREVTRAEFKLFAEQAKFQTDAEKKGGCVVLRAGKPVKDGNLNWRRVPADQGDDHPVTCVTYKDALAYTAWLSKETDRKFRLPSEREWEYAARGGTDSAWWWGAAVAEGGANCDGCGGRSSPRTLPAASLLGNPFGLHDVAGNVAEWTCTVYAPKLADDDGSCRNLQLGLRPFATPPSIAIRGGSFALPAERARSGARQNAPANEPRFDTGFRVALDP
jgi:formylglycine-generating enzyme required for sulfatase activity/serine/threonine protein kinase